MRIQPRYWRLDLCRPGLVLSTGSVTGRIHTHHDNFGVAEACWHEEPAPSVHRTAPFGCCGARDDRDDSTKPPCDLHLIPVASLVLHDDIFKAWCHDDHGLACAGCGDMVIEPQWARRPMRWRASNQPNNPNHISRTAKRWLSWPLCVPVVLIRILGSHEAFVLAHPVPENLKIYLYCYKGSYINLAS